MPSTTILPNNAGTKSGIITSSTGERHIPSSVRPDGTKRKEIRIRPGYRPPEDVEVYKNRTAEAWKTRGSGGVPGAAGFDSDTSIGDVKAASKNAKRREARKKAKAAGGDEEIEDVQTNGSSKAAKSAKEAIKDDAQATEPDGVNIQESVPSSEAVKEKQARNLKKKLRQARELREKKDKGENLLPEQFEKVIKINELIRQLDGLGFDAEGEPKSQ